MADTIPSLETVRARIDAVDDAILRLLNERIGLAEEISAAKRAEPVVGPTIRPTRETQVVRRLLALPGRKVPDGITVRLWREIMADGLSRQGPFFLTAFGGRDPARIAELARLRFGDGVLLRMVDAPEAAIAAARTQGGVSILPLEGAAPWARLLAQPSLRVFGVLPCLRAWGPPTALALSEAPVEPIGGEQTLWVSDAPGPASRTIEALSVLGLAAEVLAEGGGVRLYALAGFVQAEDERLKSAPGRLTGVIGTAPLPFDL